VGGRVAGKIRLKKDPDTKTETGYGETVESYQYPEALVIKPKRFIEWFGEVKKIKNLLDNGPR